MCWTLMLVQFLIALCLLSFKRVRGWSKYYCCRRRKVKKLGKHFLSDGEIDLQSIDESSIAKEKRLPVLAGKESFAFVSLKLDGDDWDPQHMNASNRDEISQQNLDGIDIDNIQYGEDFLPCNLKEEEEMEMEMEKNARHTDDLAHSPKKKKMMDFSIDGAMVSSHRTCEEKRPGSSSSRKGFVSRRLSNYSVSDRVQETNPVLQTYRSQQNFLRSNDDVSIVFPSEYLPEYVPLGVGYDASQSWHILNSILMSKEAFELIIVAAGCSFLSSSLSSIVAMVHQYENEFNKNCAQDTGIERVYYTDWVESNGIALKATIGM